MLLHAGQTALSFRIGGTLRRGGDLAFLTDTNVAAADTVAGLRTAVDAVVVHADVVPAKHRLHRAINMGDASGELTDALVLGLTTVEGLVGLTAATGKANRDLVIE